MNFKFPLAKGENLAPEILEQVEPIFQRQFICMKAQWRKAADVSKIPSHWSKEEEMSDDERRTLWLNLLVGPRDLAQSK